MGGQDEEIEKEGKILRDSDSEFEDEDEGGQWVTKDNLHKHIGHQQASQAIDLLQDRDKLIFEGKKDEANKEEENTDKKD